MKRARNIAVGITAALAFGLGAAAIAHPGAMGGTGPQMKGGMPARGGMGYGPMGAQPQLVTPEERSAFEEKMRNASTPEERQEIAQAQRAEIERRAKEKGITLPGPHGPHAAFGPFSGPSSK